MIGYSEEARVMELLAPLRRLEPLPFAGSTQPRRQRLRRPFLVAAAFVVALALTGVAIANGVGAFNGIGAAQRPQSGADVIDPATQAYMEGQNCNRLPSEPPPHCMPIIGGLLFDTARVVGQLPTGQNIYVITTTWKGLCFVVGPPHPEWNCDDPLSRSHPSTAFVYGQGPKPWTTGIALDGVTAVSFQADGQEVTVPVKDNVWSYPGAAPEAFLSLTAHFADGSTVVETH